MSAIEGVAELTFELCSIDSTTGSEAALLPLLRQKLEGLGFQCSEQQVGDSGRSNLLATLCDKPEILLTTHMDTVPPYLWPQFSEDKKKLEGRGVCDAKGIMAAMMLAAVSLEKQGEQRVGLLFLVGEETNSDGAKAAAQGFVPRVRYLINGEPTDLKLASAMKGSLVFELECHGQAGHSAYPESGRNALHDLISMCNIILNESWPKNEKYGLTQVNLGMMQAGTAANVLAATARVQGIFRLSVDAEIIESRLLQLIGSQAKLTILSRSNPRDLELLKGFDTCVVSFGCDIPHLGDIGKPLLFGPGSILDAHTAHEKVLVSDLEAAATAYVDMSKLLLE